MAGPIPPAVAAAIGGGKLKAGSFRKCGGKDFFCKIFCFCWVYFFILGGGLEAKIGVFYCLLQLDHSMMKGSENQTEFE